MSKESSKSAPGGKGSPTPVERAKSTPAPSAGEATRTPDAKKPPFFRRCDWISFGLTTLLTFIGYYLTLAPDLTLEDSGELAVGSFYAGVPHPPGYPVWTIYTWLFTVLVPVSNIAWRVALSSAVAAALASGLLALITSRGSSMILESLPSLSGRRRHLMSGLIFVVTLIFMAKGLAAVAGFLGYPPEVIQMVQTFLAPLIAGAAVFLFWQNTSAPVRAPQENAPPPPVLDRRLENHLCIVTGLVAGVLIAFNGYMWSQAVIAEVYTLSVLSLVLTFVFLMRWLYEPERIRWLAWAFFLFGVCFTNHQTLICAAMGIEVLIAIGRPKLGRLLFLVNSLVYLLGLLVKATGYINLFEGNKPIFIIFNIVGIASLHAFLWMCSRLRTPTRLWLTGVHVFINLVLIWLAMREGSRIGESTLAAWMLWVNPVFIFATYGVLKMSDLAEWVVTEWRPVKAVLISGLAFVIGVSFYLYMPLASMTNPPMNWGYPRTVDGFIHAFTRGQYEKTNPTESLAKFVDQCWMLLEGALDEFGLFHLLLVLVPFAFLLAMRRREQAWLIGQVAVYLCLSVLLIILLNPNSDKQSRDLTKVFFTASHVTLAMFAGYGIALIGGLILTCYREYRDWLLYSGFFVCTMAVFTLRETYAANAYPLARLSALIAFVILGVLTVLLLFKRERLKLPLVLALIAISPSYLTLAHWSDNEQRGHLFGWYFGHDMFIPPFKDKVTGELSYDPDTRAQLLADPEKSKLVYPEMSPNAILFGGTDPGRFAPTYMIFCESFIPPHKRRNPNFDRRDVYIITQNALADHTYLSYIRAHYNRSAQKDPPFFQGLLLSAQERTQPAERQWEIAGRKLLPKLLLLSTADRVFTDLGAKIEARRRAEGVYPPDEIYTPTPLDSARSFEEYLQDAARRKQLGQLRAGEVVDIIPMPGGNDRIQVAGQVSVMAINGILAKIIFDRNPTNEFYVEESFPLDWMFPHLTPFGTILKINRQPVPEFTEEIFQRDRHFWQEYSERLIGNWITEETTVQEICDFVERVHTRRDYTGFTGDRKFIRDDQAQKSFSKLRGAIAGTYLWRLGALSGIPTPQQYLPQTEEQRQRLLREAEFAWKQAFAYCPYSPEAVFKYAGLLLNLPGRMADAKLIAQTALDIDPNNAQFKYLRDEIAKYQESEMSVNQLQQQIGQLIASFQADPANLTSAFALASAYTQLQQSNAAYSVLDRLLAASNVTADAVIQTALFARELRNVQLMERALIRLTEVNAQSPEAWFDRAALQASLGKLDEAAQGLRRSLLLSDQRLATQPAGKDLRQEAAVEERFAPLRTRPDWQTILQPEQP
jgi:tetratricopeptide (TPR) repeat protein